MIQLECVRFENKLKAVRAKGIGAARKSSPRKKSKPDWLKAHGRISLVCGVLQKTNRDLNSRFWKKEWIPTRADLRELQEDCTAIAQSATKIRAWLRR